MIKRSCILILLILLVGGAAQANLGPNIVTDIEIKGNEFVPTEDIKEVLEIEVGDEVDGDILRNNLEKIYEMGWFYDIWVDYEPYDGGLRLIFEVMENFELEELQFEGVSIYSEQELREEMEMEVGKVLNTRQLNADLQGIEQKYQDNGYILARINDVRLSEEEQVLTVQINEGFLNEVRVKGNEKTRDYVIEREIVLEEGEVFNAQKAQQTLQNIYNLGFFSENIESNLEPVDLDENLFDLVIKVEEVDTGNIGAGGGYNTRDGFYGFLDVQERNLLGRGQEVGVRVELGRNRTYEVHFTEPHLLDTPYSISTSLRRRVEHDETTIVRDDKELSISSREIRQGGSISVGRQMTDEIKLSSRARLEHSHITYESGIKDPRTTQIRSISVTGQRDTTPFPFARRFNPTEGGIERATVEMAGYILGGTVDFTKFTLDLRRYYPGFAEDQNWALRLKGGTMFGPELADIPRNEKLMVGGADTLRGYDFRHFEGHRMLLFNAEYRFPIYGIFQGAGFFDVGHAWEEGESFNLAEFGVGFGAGVRLDTPLGTIRVDLGFRPDDRSLKPHLSIGQTF